MSAVLIDYDSGNLHSAHKALICAAEQVGFKDKVIISKNPEDIASASHVILPGVGAFNDCKAGILQIDGMMTAITDAAKKRKIPFLGICVGMQLMAETGHEFGLHQGFGWFDSSAVIPITELAGWSPHDESQEKRKIPHMGWNNVVFNQQSHPILTDIADDTHFYFVHSFAMRFTDDNDNNNSNSNDNIIATCNYGADITAIIADDNIVGTQFHPEKSQQSGLQLLSNFLNM